MDILSEVNVSFSKKMMGPVRGTDAVTFSGTTGGDAEGQNLQYPQCLPCHQAPAVVLHCQ